MVNQASTRFKGDTHPAQCQNQQCQKRRVWKRSRKTVNLKLSRRIRGREEGRGESWSGEGWEGGDEVSKYLPWTSSVDMVPICTWVSVMTEHGIGKPFRTVISPNESPGDSLPIITDLTRCSWSRYNRDKVLKKIPCRNSQQQQLLEASKHHLEGKLNGSKCGALRGIILLIFGACQVFKGSLLPTRSLSNP